MGALDLETKFHFHDGNMSVERIQDCTAIAENIKRQKNEGRTGSKDMKLAASLPFVIVEQYCNLNNIEFSEFIGNKEHIKRLLNDPDLKGFRVWEGRI
jgi:hypothetical protein